MDFKEEDRIARIMAQSVSGTADAEQRRVLEQWALRSPANIAVYRQAMDGGLTDSLKNVAVDPAREKAAIDAKIRRRSLRRRISWSTAAAASVAFVVALVFAGRMGSVPQGIAPGGSVAILELGDGRQVRLDTLQNALIEQHVTRASLSAHGQLVCLPTESISEAAITNTLHVPRGGEYMITLIDGTRVWLNAGSSLEYQLRFDGTERRVKLSGEGYFEVAHDADRPFVVETREQALTVLGTKFNITAYAEDVATVTTLCEGSVRVAARRSGSEVRLGAGEQAQLQGGGSEFSVSQVDAAGFARWKDGMFVFDERGLVQAMQDIARWYDIGVDAGDIDPHAIVFKGNLPKYEDLDKLLGMIEQIAPVRFHMRGRVLHVKAE